MERPEETPPPIPTRRLMQLTSIFLFVIVMLPLLARGVERLLGSKRSIAPSEILGVAVSMVLAAWVLVQVRREQNVTLKHLAELERLSLQDPLTGLGNRRAFERDLPVALRRAGRTAEPVALLYLDVDHLKALNDHHGHDAGDETLRALGGVLRSSTRLGSDASYRVGGDEFLMLLAADRDAAENVAARIARAFDERSPHHSRVSAGVVVWDGETPAHTLLREADHRMYRHKRPGVFEASA